MKIKFEPRVERDLQWFRRYYTTVFPEGKSRAAEHFRRSRAALLEHPLIGTPIENAEPMRKLVITRTPFSFHYYVEGETIIVTRLFDNRAEPVKK